MKRYYAINYPCGIASNADTGKRFGTYYFFRSRSARDQWVSDGSPYRVDKNYREAIPSSDSEIRAEIRRDSDPYQYSDLVDGDQELTMADA